MKINEYLLNEDELFELKMKSNFLKRRAGKLDLKVGIEFELICPESDINTNMSQYDYEEQSDIVSFDRVPTSNFLDLEIFLNKLGVTKSSISRITTQLNREYIDAQEQHAYESWSTEAGEQFAKQYFAEKFWKIEDHLDQIKAVAKNSIPPSLNTDRELNDAIKEYLNGTLNTQRTYYKAIKTAEEKVFMHHFVMFSSTSNYSKARFAFIKIQAPKYTEELFFKEHYPTIKSIAEKQGVLRELESAYYDSINTPYSKEDYDEFDMYYDEDVRKEKTILSVSKTFSRYTNLDVIHSSTYHGTTRKPNKYTIEPDPSLTPDSLMNEVGIEIISPPLPLDELITEIENVKKWAKNYHAYTNDSCGLHTNISIANTYLEDLDIVKLTLFLGDEYLLKQFKRELNEHAVSVISKIKRTLRIAGPEKIKKIEDSMRTSFDRKTSKLLTDGTQLNKYSSINVHKANEWYIEFRSPGGDWLNKSIDELTQTIYRCAVAMDAALDEKKYQEEYAKKLYKLLDSIKSPKEASVLSQYFAGQINIKKLRNELVAKKSQPQSDYIDED